MLEDNIPHKAFMLSVGVEVGCTGVGILNGEPALKVLSVLENQHKSNVRGGMEKGETPGVCGDESHEEAARAIRGVPIIN